MVVRFFGVRGSTPVPGPTTARYGGNTACVQVILADGSCVILDAGTGMRELGKVLLAEGTQGVLSLFLTHVHWDHIIGIPFFAPVWQRATHLRIYPTANPAQQEALRHRGLFDGVHFPVHADDVPAQIELCEDYQPVWRVGSAKVTRMALNHPGGAQGFRIDDDDDGHSIAYLTDNELSPPGPVTTTTETLARFASGVDVLIHDAQYVAADMPAKRGWGHSILDDVLKLGELAATPNLVLFHHEPERDDAALDAIGLAANATLKEHASQTVATVASEGSILKV